MRYFGGCDSGSTYTKCVIIDENGKVAADVTLRSRINSVLSAQDALNQAIEQVEELKLKAGIGPKAGQNAGESPDAGQGQNADHGQETGNGTMENVPEENHENSDGPESE